MAEITRAEGEGLRNNAAWWAIFIGGIFMAAVGLDVEIEEGNEVGKGAPVIVAGALMAVSPWVVKALLKKKPAVGPNQH
ncbi:MAG: hypothetical protein AAB439_00670 [Patescibacteria group bacterium]